MKKSFLNYGLFLILGTILLTISSCSKDKDDKDSYFTIIADNIEGNTSDVAKVKAIYFSNINSEMYEIAKADFVNNGFRLDLPSTINSKYLTEEYEDVDSRLTVSDKKAKLLHISKIDGFDKDGQSVGDFFVSAENMNQLFGINWVYSDRDFTVSGEYTENDNDITIKNTWDLNFKKGWNTVSIVISDVYDHKTSKTNQEFLVTTNIIMGAYFQWFFSN